MVTPTPRIGGRPWRRLVAFVIARDGAVCWICGKAGADTGDHVTPLALGGPAMDPDNVRAAHASCNYSRGAGPAPLAPPPPSRAW